MTWESMGLVFASSYILVFLLVIQQRTVQASRYASAFCFSILIGVAQTVITRGAVQPDLVSFLIANCLGGGTGVVSAMLLYDRLYGKDKNA